MQDILKEARIIVPEHKEALQFALDAVAGYFGGSTVTKGQGTWRDDTGKFILEPVNVIDIACPDTFKTETALRAIAHAVGKLAKQECVYVRWPSGRVELISTADPWRKPAPGIVEIPLNDPAALHNAVADAVGE